MWKAVGSADDDGYQNLMYRHSSLFDSIKNFCSCEVVMAKRKKVGVPTCVTGLISAWTGPDVCMDGATHLLQNKSGTMRLKARNKGVSSILRHAEGRRMPYTACGYIEWGAECVVLSVYSLEPGQTFEKRLVEAEKRGSLFGEGEAGALSSRKQ
jgi:hypothetical protein